MQVQVERERGLARYIMKERKNEEKLDFKPRKEKKKNWAGCGTCQTERDNYDYDLRSMLLLFWGNKS